MIKVTYLDHSAFLVELTHHVLLFDHAAITPPPIPAGKSLYVFASHAHSDHYAPAIFQLPAAAEGMRVRWSERRQGMVGQERRRGR